MRYKMRILTVICLLSLLLLSGCVSQAKYDGIEAERDTLLEENQALTQDKLELQQEQGALQGEHATLQEKYNKISNLREFRSVAELELWLSIDDTDKLEWVEGSQDCDDYARILTNNALREGYILGFFSETTIEGGEIVEQHAMNITFIDDEIYIIEPQNDYYWFAAYTWE